MVGDYRTMRLSGIILASAVLGGAVLWSFMSSEEENTGPDHPVMIRGRPVAELQGIWRSRGYGYVISIDKDRRRLYHVAGEFCYRDPRSDDEWSNTFTFYRHVEGEGIAFSIESGQTLYVFDKLAALRRSAPRTRNGRPAASARWWPRR
jgi:hypothetical protein